jgi:hypothetical protein
MSRMIRKQIVIDEEREALLVRIASERGMSQSELIRSAIDDMAARADADTARRVAHEELVRLFETAEDLGLTDENGVRTWRREDLYGDRGLR